MYRSRAEKLRELKSVVFGADDAPVKTKLLTVSNYRSGSSMLRSALSFGINDRNLGEPLGRYLQKEILRRMTKNIIKPERWLYEVTSSYLNAGYDQVAASVLVNHIHGSKKDFLRARINRGWKVIGIVRDPVDIAVSLMRAVHEGKWHDQSKTGGFNPHDTSMQRDILGPHNGFENLVNGIQMNRIEIREACQKMGLLVLDYDQHLRDVHRQNATQELIMDQFPGASVSFRHLTYKKLIPVRLSERDSLLVNSLKAQYS